MTGIVRLVRLVFTQKQLSRWQVCKAECVCQVQAEDGFDEKL